MTWPLDWSCNEFEYYKKVNSRHCHPVVPHCLSVVVVVVVVVVIRNLLFWAMTNAKTWDGRV
jgi:hypothetical protein